MNIIREIIVSKIDTDRNQVILTTGEVRAIEPERSYLIANEDGTHEKYTADSGGTISKQGKDLKNYVTLNTPEEITASKNFTEGFNINSFTYKITDFNNMVITGGKNVFGTKSNINNAAVAVGNNVFPSMNLQPFDPVTEPWNNKGYFGIGSDIFVDYTGDTNYRPSHNAHDSWVGVGRALGAGFLDGTNITMMGTTNMHRNTVKYADSVVIFGKGNTNDVTTNGSVLDPDRVVTSVKGFPIRNMMKDVTIVGSENWFEDISDSVIVGSNTRIYKYIFNSVVIGNNNVNYTGENMSEAQKNQVLDCDVIIGAGVTKSLDRHAPSHNLLMGMGYFYNTGGAPNFNYRPLIEGRYKGVTPSESASLQVNGVIIAGHENANTDSPNETDVPFNVGTLPSGVTFDGVNNFTFDGTQASTSFKIGNIIASATEAYYVTIHAAPHIAGSWGYSVNGLADSGNIAAYNFTAVQSFIATTNSDFILTTAESFEGVITILFKKTNLSGVGTLPNVILKDSFENITTEIRGGKLDNGHLSMGLNAGKFLYLGTNTIAIGKDAYAKATVGRNSVIIGNDAAKNNSASSRDVMIGYKVYENGNLGSGNNVLIGTEVLRSPTSRIIETTGVGGKAFNLLKTGGSNSGFGYLSGETLENGSNNFFGGYNSGLIKNGNNNTFLGGQAGGLNLRSSTINDTIVIGYNAIPESNAGNTTTIGTPTNTDNFLYGTTHSNSFKVRGGTGSGFLKANGTIDSNTYMLSGESSLRELKENIVEFDKTALDLVDSLSIVTFDRIDGSAKNKIGIIADDSPEEFLTEEKNAVDLYKTIFIQAKAIQELSQELKELKILVMKNLNKI